MLLHEEAKYSIISNIRHYRNQTIQDFRKLRISEGVSKVVIRNIKSSKYYSLNYASNHKLNSLLSDNYVRKGKKNP